MIGEDSEKQLDDIEKHDWVTVRPYAGTRKHRRVGKFVKYERKHGANAPPGKGTWVIVLVDPATQKRFTVDPKKSILLIGNDPRKANQTFD